MLILSPSNSHNIGKRQAPNPRTREVAPGVYSFTSNGQYISLFTVSAEGAMVFDPMNEEHSKLMLAEIRKITNAPVKYLFYSHNHWDHSSGGQVWKDEGATIVSHIEAYEYQKANPSPNVRLADMTWSSDTFQVSLGDVTVELYYFGLNHGAGMTTFVLPKQKVVFLVQKLNVFSYVTGWIHC